MRGNLLDMAIGVVMAGAFGKVVSAFIDGMVMPAVGMLTGGIDFTQQKLVLKQGVAASSDGNPAIEEVAIKYGDFITQTISFLVVAMVVFMIIKAINRMKKKQEAAPEAGPSSTDTLLMEIRDELKKR
jgi:large conductance mechanosensitive channel